jgi:GT2 family glycosyltransferase
MRADAAVPCISVVVLSYNRPVLLEGALRSIASQTYPNREVTVVDNKSASSSRIREVVAAFAGVRLISNQSNRGFTGGMNQGIAAARGEYIYLTEDDIELAPDCLTSLVRYLEMNPDVVLAGPVMWNRDLRSVRCAGGSFTLGPTYTMTIEGAGQSALSASEPYRTNFLPGAMIAARTTQLREMGGFRSDFFMYVEDVELCTRVLKKGDGIAIVPSAKVYHHEPPATPDTPELMFHRQKNLAALYLLHAPWSVLPGFLLRYAGMEGLRRFLRPSHFVPWAKAWGWVVLRSPQLLAQRFGILAGA